MGKRREDGSLRTRLFAVLARAGVWPRHDAVALLAAVLPVVLSALGLKLARVLAYDEPLSLGGTLLLLQSDVLAMLALSAWAFALGALGVASSFSRTLLALVQLLLLPVFAIVILAYGYHRATGTVLDYGMIHYALSRPSETWPIVANEATPGLSAIIAAGLCVLLALPWLLRSLVLRRGATREAEPRSRAAWWTCAALCVLGTASGYAGYVARAGDLPTSFASDPVLYVLHGALDEQDELAHLRGKAKPRKTGAQSLVRASKAPPLNLVVIVLESTRHDATSVYSKREITPFLRDFAKDASVVERAYAVMPHTSKALVASLCGFDPRASTEITESGEGGLPGKCLAKLLAEQGYQTAFFQAPRSNFEARADLVKNLGYERFFSGERVSAKGFEKVNYFGYEDEIMLEPSKRWLERAKEPLFATYLTSTTHHPYGIPKRLPRKKFPGNAPFRAYLNAQAYDDGYVRKLIAQYDAKGLSARTVFVIFGDHGEAFGEHGLWTHDGVVYEAGLRVPLIVRVPESMRASYPKRVPGPVSQLALVPTLVPMLGFAAQDGGYEAPSIFSGQAAGALYAGCYRRSQCLALIEGRHKLVYYYRDRPAELYDVVSDPKERKNLAKGQPVLVESMIADALAWTASVDETYYRSSAGPTLARYVSQRAPTSTEAPLPRLARFGDFLEVNDCVLVRRADGHFDATCRFHVLAKPPTGTRVRIRENDGEDQALQDHEPVKGFYPPQRWKAGDYITDEFKLHLPGALRDAPATLCVLVEDAAGRALSPSQRSDGLSRDACVRFATVTPRPEDVEDLKPTK